MNLKKRTKTRTQFKRNLTTIIQIATIPLLLIFYINTIARMYWKIGYDHDEQQLLQEKSEKEVDSTEEEDYEKTTPIRVPVEETPKTTGSFSNCVKSPLKSPSYLQQKKTNTNTDPNDSDSGTVVTSCHRVQYRAPLQSFRKLTHTETVIIGVLSNAGDDGPARRKSIRRTWAQNQNGIFFLVAGPWYKIQQEYATHGDLIWIDEEEIYNAQESVLTLKSYSFLAIVQSTTERIIGEQGGFWHWTHLFKTDDDSYVDVQALKTELTSSSHSYAGKCQIELTKVVRDEAYKWSLSKRTYPESHLPKYCQGAGYAVSKDFINCAVNNGHIAQIRFMPLEDVAVGMLAERCQVEPTITELEVKIPRYESKEANERVKRDDGGKENLIPIAACMTDRIVQHRVIDSYDMEELHKSVLDPLYCKVTRRKRGQMIEEANEKGIRWYG